VARADASHSCEQASKRGAMRQKDKANNVNLAVAGS
jgi:hypothetical protein